MNRLATDTDNISFSPTQAKSKDLHDIRPLKRRRSSRPTDSPIATFRPMSYEANYAYPLVIWLHTTANNEHDLRRVMPLVSTRNYVAVAPRGTWTHPRHQTRYGWRQTSEMIDSAQVRVDESIALAEREFNVHPKRIFLVGHGSGATMALRIGWSQPNRFAGVVAINGPLPTQLSPLSRINEVRRVPCFLVTSRDSRAYPANRVCRDLRLLHAAGCTVALRQYPGGDDLTTTMLADIDRWLMELVCGTVGNG